MFLEDWEHTAGADLYPNQRQPVGICYRVLRENLAARVRAEPGSPERNQVALCSAFRSLIPHK